REKETRTGETGGAEDMTAQRSLGSLNAVAAAALLVTSLVAWPSPQHALAATATTFSGRATVVSGKVAGIAVGPLADTGPVRSSGGALDATLLEYPINGAPDPTNPVPTLGSIIVNEQVASASAGQGNITVNALHIMLTDPLGNQTDLVVASAHADIACGVPTLCAGQDFITGGGWITTSSGSKA